MSLKEILEKIAADQASVCLSNANGSYKAQELLNTLPDNKLKIRSFYQQGLYIAKISEAGFLSDVLYRVK